MSERVKLFLPLLIFVVLAVVFWKTLKQEGYDPQYLPSALVNKPVPAFQLESLADADVKLSESVLAQGVPQLVNVWATWCVACRVEHPFLNQLAQQGVSIVGLNYKDERVKAQEWLSQLGDPYARNLFDVDGRVGLDLGVYGAPETYIVDGKGVVRYKHVGIVDEKVWKEVLEPEFRKWKSKP